MLTLIQQYEKLLKEEVAITNTTKDKVAGIFESKDDLSFSMFMLELLRYSTPALFYTFTLLLRDGVKVEVLYEAYKKDIQGFLQKLTLLRDRCVKKKVHLPKAEADYLSFCGARDTSQMFIKQHMLESFLLKKPVLPASRLYPTLMCRFAFIEEIPNKQALQALFKAFGIRKRDMDKYDFWGVFDGGFRDVGQVLQNLQEVKTGNAKPIPATKMKTSKVLPDFFYFRNQEASSNAQVLAARDRASAWTALVRALTFGNREVESFILYCAHCGIPLEQMPDIMMKDPAVFTVQQENFLSMGNDVTKLKKFELKNNHLVTGSFLNEKEKRLFQEYFSFNHNVFGNKRIRARSFWCFYFLESLMKKDKKGYWVCWDRSTNQIRQKKYEFLTKEYLQGCRYYLYPVSSSHHNLQFLTSAQSRDFLIDGNSSTNDTRNNARLLIQKLALSDFDFLSSTTESPLLHRNLISVPKNLVPEDANTIYEKASDKSQRLVFRPSYGQVGWFDPTNRILEVSGGLTEASGIYSSSRRNLLVLGASVLGLDNTKFTGWLHLQHDSSTGVFILPDQDWDKLSPLFQLGWFLYPQFQRHTNISWKMLPSKNGGTWDACYGHLGLDNRFVDRGAAGVTALLSATTPNLDRDNYGLVGLHIPENFFPTDLKPLAERLAKNPAPMQTNILTKFLTFELGCIHQIKKKVYRAVPSFLPEKSRWEWDKKKEERLQPLEVHNQFGCQIAQAVKNLKTLHYISSDIGNDATKIQGGRAKIVKGLLVPKKTAPEMSNYELWYNICRPYKQGIYINDNGSAGNIKDQRNCSVKELKGLNLSNKNRKSVCSWEALLTK